MNCNLRVAQNEDCAALMLVLCGVDAVKLETLDLWVKLQGYYFFSTAEERQEIDQRGASLLKRMNVTKKVWDEGIKALKSIGFIEDLGSSKWRLLRGHEVLAMLEAKASKKAGYVQQELVAV